MFVFCKFSVFSTHFSFIFCTFASMETVKKRITFIVNPISGTRSKDGLDKKIAKAIDSNRYEWQIVMTQRAGHAIEIAHQCAADGTDICVAVGGDGTVNEVASGLTGSTTALGIIPMGSGNGLARHLCLPMSVKGALDIINQGETAQFDYGLINDHPFFCTCGMGFDAHVSLKFAQSGKRGLTTYAKMVLSEGLHYQPDTYTITFEDDQGKEQKCEAFLVACANAAQYGNNTYIAPSASMQDGLLDVIIIEPFGSIGGPKVLTELFTKTLYSNRHVRHFQARSIHIHRPSEGAVHFDGDPVVMGTDIQVQIVPRGIWAVINARAIEDHARPNAVVKRLMHPLGGKKLTTEPIYNK